MQVFYSHRVMFYWLPEALSLQTAFTDEFEFDILRTAHGQKRLVPRLTYYIPTDLPESIKDRIPDSYLQRMFPIL
jgi:hypothetical protein